MSFNKKQVDAFLERNSYDIETVIKARRVMDAMRFRFNKLKAQLEKNKDLSFLPIDEIHLSTLVICEEIQMLAFMDIIEKGTLMGVDAAGLIKQKNHSNSTVFQMSKIINETSCKLGLSALDRKNMKIETTPDDGMKD